MPDTEPISLAQALSQEYRALRPDSGFRETDNAEELFRKLHQEPAPLSALCISGGGIRSATFALGVIQGLAEKGLLPQFDYLSTVSGGGYAGSWLTAWSNRAGGLDKVIPSLRRDAPPAGEPDPIGHLREYSNYLTPKLGALSADTWTLAATVLRNILLNWMVLIPLLMFDLIVPRVFLSALTFPYLGMAAGAVDYRNPRFNWISESILVHYGLPVLGAVCFTWTLFFTLRYLPGIGNENHTAYQYIRNVLTPLILSVLAYVAFNNLYYLGANYRDYTNGAAMIVATEIPCLAAWVVHLVFWRIPVRQRLRAMFGPLSLAIVMMAAGTGGAAWVLSNKILWNPDPAYAISWATYVTVALPLLLLGFSLGSAIYAGLSSRALQDNDREWMSRSSAHILRFSAAWLGACALVLILPRYAFTWHTWVKSAVAAAGAVSAWASAFGGSPAKAGSSEKDAKGGWMLPLAARLAPPVFIGLLAVGIAVLTNILLSACAPLFGKPAAAVAWWDHNLLLEQTDLRTIGFLSAACLLLSWFMARYVNINTFSLHDMYRDRLVRAYLGASNPKRQVSGFTGFARTDDIPMARLDPALKPLHVLNLTLNLVAGDRLAWQQRKAEAFTVSRFHCGAQALGYRPSDGYGGPQGISLGTAMTISGAAASPSMGYYSSPLIGFIMTLFNARLGAWLGNPGKAGAQTWRHAGPRSAFVSLAKEALGLTSDRSAYVYLSDGGHFENLGLYEMVIRRAKIIVVLDAACDPQMGMGDLGNALRKLRIDSKIPIDFDEPLTDPLRRRSRRCAVGVIRYSAVDGRCDDGCLIVIKPLVLGCESQDVLSYAKMNPTFPHQTTADQWFDESQMESYRMLGLSSIDDICRGWQGGSLQDFRVHVETVYLGQGSRGSK